MLDALDQALLDALTADARTPTASLARQLDVSRSTVQARLQRLEEKGIIAGYTVRLAEDWSNRRIRAHVQMSVSPKLAARVVQALKAMPEIRALHTVSGAMDMIAEVSAATMEDMDSLTDRIGALSGVERTQTLLLMATRFSR